MYPIHMVTTIKNFIYFNDTKRQNQQYYCGTIFSPPIRDISMLSTWPWSSASENCWAWLRWHFMCKKNQLIWAPYNIITNNNQCNSSREIGYDCITYVCNGMHWYTSASRNRRLHYRCSLTHAGTTFCLRWRWLVLLLILYLITSICNVKPLEEREMRDLQRRYAPAYRIYVLRRRYLKSTTTGEDDERARLARWWRKLFGNLM